MPLSQTVVSSDSLSLKPSLTQIFNGRPKMGLYTQASYSLELKDFHDVLPVKKVYDVNCFQIITSLSLTSLIMILIPRGKILYVVFKPIPALYRSTIKLLQGGLYTYKQAKVQSMYN
ncbi:hypothetical protein XENOCAPTIV_000106 [Xenoophorus captivus]|uniref:Uncharacterized protein n=1 Tax=Xenoophorus captivus TaxID=1517983 RepID=A0ABV0RT90_9TELE